jgi:hypothetical protein
MQTPGYLPHLGEDCGTLQDISSTLLEDSYIPIMFRNRALSRLITSRGVHIEAKIAQMGLVLPPPGAPKGSYKNVVQTGNYLFLAGKTMDYVIPAERSFYLRALFV